MGRGRFLPASSSVKLFFLRKTVEHEKGCIKSGKLTKPMIYHFFMRIYENNRRIFYRFSFTIYRINRKWRKRKEEKNGGDLKHREQGNLIFTKIFFKKEVVKFI